MTNANERYSGTNFVRSRIGKADKMALRSGESAFASISTSSLTLATIGSLRGATSYPYVNAITFEATNLDDHMSDFFVIAT